MLRETRAGVAVDWSEGTLTASGGAAADLRMPNAAAARAGSLRRAEAAARKTLERALAELPLGGGRKLDADEVARAGARACVTATDYQSNGGVLVRLTSRFGDWRPEAASPGARPAAVLVVPSMALAAAPVVRVGRASKGAAGDAGVDTGAAVYRLGPAPRDVGAVAAKVDRAGRVVVDGALAEKLAHGTLLIYVEKVTR
ncbi:MAG TPA: hypothetical protein VHJ20_09450 [Polyangia bacterium]|nr:hypothetical protein [Polyangia bacterium]